MADVLQSNPSLTSAAVASAATNAEATASQDPAGRVIGFQGPFAEWKQARKLAAESKNAARKEQRIAEHRELTLFTRDVPAADMHGTATGVIPLWAKLLHRSHELWHAAGAVWCTQCFGVVCSSRQCKLMKPCNGQPSPADPNRIKHGSAARIELLMQGTCKGCQLDAWPDGRHKPSIVQPQRIPCSFWYCNSPRTGSSLNLCFLIPNISFLIPTIKHLGGLQRLIMISQRVPQSLCEKLWCPQRPPR